MSGPISTAGRIPSHGWKDTRQRLGRHADHRDRDVAAALLPQLHVAAQEVGADDDESAVETAIIEFGDTFDWVRVVSGEWLAGEIRGMRDDKLVFESDKFDTQQIDFTDVTELHSPQLNTYLFGDRTSAIGRGVITADKVIVETDEGTKIFDRSKLESIILGGKREKDSWSMKLSFGLTLNRGNNDQLVVSLSLEFG